MYILEFLEETGGGKIEDGEEEGERTKDESYIDQIEAGKESFRIGSLLTTASPCTPTISRSSNNKKKMRE